MNEERKAPAIVLVRSQEEGNVGAAARAMANMGLDELILVEPAVAIGNVARARAVHAGHVLDGARRAASLAEALAPFRRVVGTTSSRSRAMTAPLISARELPARLEQDPPHTPTALVFGPEVSGLDREELARCSLLVSIPCAKVQPTLNLSQAVLIVAYDLRQHRIRTSPSPPSGDLAATVSEIDGLFDQAIPLLEKGGFARDDTFGSVLRDLRHFAARSAPTAREVQILRGICRRLEHALEP